MLVTRNCAWHGSAQSAGFYKHPLMATPYPKVKIVTIREMIEDGARLDLPLSLEVLKTAAKIKVSSSQITMELDEE